MKKTLAIIVPVYNEADSINEFDQLLRSTLAPLPDLIRHIVYVNDGSTDASYKLLTKLARDHNDTTVLCLSRNFGKEIATTAGILETDADALLTLDADGQHPVERISDFIAAWQDGAQVVVGVRTQNQGEGAVKRLGSKLFYYLMRHLSSTDITPGLTDFRLIDREVKDEYSRMTERSRITRGLIEWMGYPTAYIDFVAHKRIAGAPSYSYRKLQRLAIDSFISMSTTPLVFVMWLGLSVLVISLLLGAFMVLNALLHDPWHLDIRGSAYLIVFVTFLTGIILVSQGVLGLYMAQIHKESQGRPLYIVNRHRSLFARKR